MLYVAVGRGQVKEVHLERVLFETHCVARAVYTVECIGDKSLSFTLTDYYYFLKNDMNQDFNHLRIVWKK